MPDIPVTKNYASLKKADAAGKFYKVLEGSSGSGKTISVIQYLIEKALSEPRRITGFRHDQATCSDSIIADFQKIMVEQFGIWNQRNWNGSKFTYKFKNGSTFSFRGANTPAKLHGPRRAIAWGNEVMEMGYEAHRQIIMRTSEEVIYDFNPSLNHHWVFDKVLTRDDVAYVHSTFRDNPMLPANARAEILAMEPTPHNIAQGTADEWAWTVYGLGKRGRKEGAIFKLWDVVDDWPDPMLCERWGYGLDFGFKDPTALVECALFQSALYLRERIYESELITQRNEMEPQIPSIEGKMKALGVPGHARIHSECAKPETVRALTMAGFKLIPTIKSADSIFAGIDRMLSLPIRVHRSSHNLQMELENYCWDKNAEGEFVDVPIDKWNHLIDAARYWSLVEIKPSRKRYGESKGRRSRKAKSNLKVWR